eukprot:gene1670-1035_t
MFYCVVEMSCGALFESWTPAVVAFDCTRRYLYCSAPLKKGQGVPTCPCSLRWKKKAKVMSLRTACLDMYINTNDESTKEKQLYAVDVIGTKRELAKNEFPPPEPLLCPSTGLQPIPGRFSLGNEEFIQDPFFLNELYEGLLDTFINLRLAREASTSVAGSSRQSDFSTLDSPGRDAKARTFSIDLFKETDELFRFTNAYDYRRLMYVMQWVLSFDKLVPSPHGGYPPYDPRNGVVLAPVPLYLWRWFHAWETQTLHYMGPGSLLRQIVNLCSHSVSGGKGVRGGHLCILDGSVFFLYNRDGSAKPDPYCVLSLHQVRRVFYSGRRSHHPCVLFMTEGERDLLFLPEPQRLGKGVETMFPQAALAEGATECPSSTLLSPDRLYRATLEVLHIAGVVRNWCLSSVETLPVIAVECLDVVNVPEFVTEVQRRCGRVPLVQYDQGPLPEAKRLADVWNAYRAWMRRQQREQGGRALSVGIPAVPIYENNPSKIPLSEAQLRELQARVGQRRQRRHGSSVDSLGGIVGFTLEDLTDGPEEGPLPLRTAALDGRKGDGLHRVLSMSLNDISLDSVPSFVEPDAEYMQQGCCCRTIEKEEEEEGGAAAAVGAVRASHRRMKETEAMPVAVPILFFLNVSLCSPHSSSLGLFPLFIPAASLPNGRIIGDVVAHMYWFLYTPSVPALAIYRRAYGATGLTELHLSLRHRSLAAIRIRRNVRPARSTVMLSGRHVQWTCVDVLRRQKMLLPSTYIWALKPSYMILYTNWSEAEPEGEPLRFAEERRWCAFSSVTR